MRFSKLVYFLSSLILSIWLSAFTAVWAGGTPAGLTISTNDGTSVIAFNFNSSYTSEEANEMFGLAQLVYNLLGVEGTVTLFPPNQLKSAGYDGDSLHNALVSILSGLESYIQVKAGKYPVSAPKVHIFDIWAWSPGDTSGFYIGDIELPEELALLDLLGILNEGSRYINIITRAPYNNGIAEVLRMELYYMESATAERAYLASVEISADAIRSVFESFIGGMGL